jgi:hypothetical protein
MHSSASMKKQSILLRTSYKCKNVAKDVHFSTSLWSECLISIIDTYKIRKPSDMSTIYRVLAKGNPLSFLLQCRLYSLLLYNTILFDFYNT